MYVWILEHVQVFAFPWGTELKLITLQVATSIHEESVKLSERTIKRTKDVCLFNKLPFLGVEEKAKSWRDEASTTEASKHHGS